MQASVLIVDDERDLLQLLKRSLAPELKCEVETASSAEMALQRLAHGRFDLILAGQARQIPPTLLVGDDRVRLTVNGAGLIVAGVPELAGKIEIRGLGIRSIGFALQAPVAVVVDLDAADADRLPTPQALKITLSGLYIIWVVYSKIDKTCCFVL